MRPAYSSQGALQCSLCQRATSSPRGGSVRCTMLAVPPSLGPVPKHRTYKKGVPPGGYLSCASMGKWGTGWGWGHVMM